MRHIWWTGAPLGNPATVVAGLPRDLLFPLWDYPQACAMSRHDRIATRLTETFAPSLLDVQDDSAHHAGHAGAQAGGETHYTVTMVSEVFLGQSRVARSRAVHEALEDELASGLHALALILRAPGEAGSSVSCEAGSSVAG
jgi:stress-induced morphogen